MIQIEKNPEEKIQWVKSFGEKPFVTRETTQYTTQYRMKVQRAETINVFPKKNLELIKNEISG